MCVCVCVRVCACVCVYVCVCVCVCVDARAAQKLLGVLGGFICLSFIAQIIPNALLGFCQNPRAHIRAPLERRGALAYNKV